jgi:hypothetical protein
MKGLNMVEQIDNAIKRARGYWFVDGFTEMATGGLFIILVVALLLSGSASPATFSSWFLSVASVISIIKLISLLAAILILWWLKDHFTYPRTGFVRGTRITVVQILAILRNVILFLLLPILGLLAALLLIASTSGVLSSMPVWFPVGLGILWAIFFVLAGEWLGLRRFRLMGIMVLLVGATIGLWQFAIGLPVLPANLQPEISQPVVLESIIRALTSLNFLVLITGLILIFSGLITFLRYRRENPTPYAEDV